MIVTLAAGESQNITIAGARFYFVTGDGKINLKIKGSGDSRDFDLYPRMGIDSDQRFSGVEIRNIHDAEQTIEFEISDRGVFDNRIPEVTQIEPLDGTLPVVVSDPVYSQLSFSGHISSDAGASTSPIVLLGVLVDDLWGDREMLIDRVSVRIIGELAPDVCVSLTTELNNITSDGAVFDFVGASLREFGATDGNALSLSADAVMGNSDTTAIFAQPIDSVVTSTDKAARNVVFDLSATPYKLKQGVTSGNGLGIALVGLGAGGFASENIKATGTGTAYIYVKATGRLV